MVDQKDPHRNPPAGTFYSMTRTKKRKPSFSPEPQTEPPEQTQHPTPKHDSDVPSSSPAAYNLPSPPSVYPPGHRFVPTDEEIISNYCQGNIKSKWPNLLVHEVNIYESNPQQLSEEYEKGNLKEWFFISERTKVNKGGKNHRRSDNGGFWSATIAAKKIEAEKGLVGYKTGLVHYVGKPPNAVKSDWLMQEYRLESSHDTKTTVDYAFYKIYLSPHAKNRKKKAEEEIEQTRHHDDIAYQQQQFHQPPMGLHQPQTQDMEPQQPQTQEQEVPILWEDLLKEVTIEDNDVDLTDSIDFWTEFAETIFKE